MSLQLALSNAVSGLKLNQQQLSVLSNNMANVNTEGYSRKQIEQTAVYVEGSGQGVRIDDVVRKVDSYLIRSAMTQGSSSSAAGVVADYYEQLQVLLGAPGAENSLDEYFTTFFNTIEQMADQPDRTSYRSNLVNSANLLADEVSGLAYEMENLRFQADQDIAGAVTEVNAALKKLHELNSSIARAAAVGQSTAGLLDERDAALRVVSSNLDISTYMNANGTVQVTTTSGVSLVDGQLHQLQYKLAASVDSMIGDVRLSALTVIAYDGNGNVSGTPQELVTAGRQGEVKSKITSGKMAGLIDLRDNLVPDILDQLDMLASRLRDAMNGLHNNGSGWPPAQSLTGTRQVSASQQSDWSGTFRIGVLTTAGKPVPSGYADEAYTGVRPLTLDLSRLSSGDQPGKFTVQTLVDEINAHFNAPTTKAQVGNLNNIELVSTTKKLPSGGINLFDFELELDNISKLDSSLFVSNVTVRDSGGAAMPGAWTGDQPSVTLNPAASYTTYAGESHVDIGLVSTEGLKVGDRIYLGPPSIADANGIDDSALTGYFTITEVTNGTVRIDTGMNAAASGTVADPTPASLKLPYATAEAGEKMRTGANGGLQVDFSSNYNSPFYDITVEVGVVDEEGNVSTSQITYRVKNFEENLYNDRYPASSANGDGSLELPTSTQPSLRAILVGADGRELAKVNGQYVDAPASLKIVGATDDYVVALDEMDSQQLGDLANGVPGSGWGLSHYFGLNDFFAANEPSATGDTLKGSAINLRVEKRLLDNPNLVSSGKLVLSPQPADGEAPPQYTYVRYSGDNSAAQAMAALSTIPIGFDSAGGLPNTALSLQSYTSEMLGYLASISSAAQDKADNAQLLYEGFSERAAAISGVNLDEELANTIVFQNSYSATARVITVVNEMFEALVNTL